MVKVIKSIIIIFIRSILCALIGKKDICCKKEVSSNDSKEVK